MLASHHNIGEREFYGMQTSKIHEHAKMVNYLRLTFNCVGVSIPMWIELHMGTSYQMYMIFISYDTSGQCRPASWLASCCILDLHCELGLLGE